MVSIIDGVANQILFRISFTLFTYFLKISNLWLVLTTPGPLTSATSRALCMPLLIKAVTNCSIRTKQVAHNSSQNLGTLFLFNLRALHKEYLALLVVYIFLFLVFQRQLPRAPRSIPEAWTQNTTRNLDRRERRPRPGHCAGAETASAPRGVRLPNRRVPHLPRPARRHQERVWDHHRATAREDPRAPAAQSALESCSVTCICCPAD